MNRGLLTINVCRWLWLIGLLLGVRAGFGNEERAVSLRGGTVVLQDVSTQTEVRFQSLRLNRALNVWNVEATVRNTGTNAIKGPLVLSIEGFSGTSGPLQPDGQDSLAHPCYDLSTNLAALELAPGAATSPRTLSLALGAGAPLLTNKVFAAVPATNLAALAVASSLNAYGQPLMDVVVEETGPAGQRLMKTDNRFGLVTLGVTNGLHQWRFSKVGYLPAWRESALTPAEVALLPSPRLTQRSAQPSTLTPLSGGALTNADGSIRLAIEPGQFAQETTATLTALGSQSLPAFLPLGWSPLAAFWLELAAEPVRSINATLIPWGPISPGESAILARWNAGSLRWDILGAASGNGTNGINLPLPGSGAFVLVVADTGEYAPPAAQIGQPLAGVTSQVTNFSRIYAGGQVVPSTIPASKLAELVTATGQATFTNQDGALPSGLLLRCEITERYLLQDQTRRNPPRYTANIVAYQRPGDQSPATVGAAFPLRPLLLYGADELLEGRVTIDILEPGRFTGGILETNGGVVAGDGVAILASVGDLAGRQAVQIRRLEVTNFFDLALAGSNTVVVAFELGVGEVVSGRRLRAQLGTQTTNSYFVLARVLTYGGITGLEPVERFISDTTGALSTAEPATGERLPGITGAGQYLLLKVGGSQALILGVARNTAGQPAENLVVRTPGQPWMTLSAADGAYRLIGPVGNVAVSALELTSGDFVESQVTVVAPQTPVTLDLATAASGPRVAEITPASGAKSIPRVTAIVVRFSEPVNPATLAANGIELLGTNGQPVAASLSLNLRNTIATLLPTAPLSPSSLHTVRISTNVADLTGARLEGTNTFTFTTASDELNRAPAQLIIYEPTNGLAAVYGTPGTADAEVPVILVNETSGRTATILSKTDGSFTNFIEAEVEDFLSAVLVNQNGTRTVVPASRQIFRDGSVGLYNGGGILEAEGDGGPLQVIVEPGTIPNKTKFKIDSIPLTQILELVNNTQPENGQVLGGLRYNFEGDSPKTAPDVSLPVNPASLNLNPGEKPEDRDYALCEVIKVEGVTVYNMVDTMQYENGRLVTHSPPFPGMGFGAIFVAGMMPIGLTDRLTVVGSVWQAPASVAADGLTVAEIGQRTNLNVRAVAGAVVSADPDLAAGNLRPGLRPGSYVTRTDKDGVFAMRVPFNAYLGSSFSMIARHSRFPTRLARRTLQAPTIHDSVLPLSEVILAFSDSDVDASDRFPPHLAISPPSFVLPVGQEIELPFFLRDNLNTPRMDSISVDFTNSFRTVPRVEALDPTNVVSLAMTSSSNLSHTVVQQNVKIQLDRAAYVRLKINCSDSAGNTVVIPVVLYFGAPPDILADPLPSSNPDDHAGPQVSSIKPEDGTMVSALEFIQVLFSEPVMRSSVSNTGAISMSGPRGTQPNTHLELSEDQTQLKIYPGTLEPGQTYTLTINNQVTDISTNAFDQDPSTTNLDSFIHTFHTAPVTQTTLPQIQRSAGTVAWGDYSFTIDRMSGQSNGALVVHRLDPNNFQTVQFRLPPFPRALALIPEYSFKRRPTEPGAATNHVLVAVAGGLGGGAPDETGLLTTMGQWLWIIDVTDPQNPQRIASQIISVDSAAAATVLRWSPPNLGVLMLEPEQSVVNLINLQAFILGANYTLADFDAAALTNAISGAPGLDSNSDGDYVDADELLPVPNRIGIFGITPPVLETAPNRSLIDFDMGFGGSFQVGVLPKLASAPARFQVLLFGGAIIGRGAENDPGAINFTNRRPNRVLLDLEFPIPDTNGIRALPAALVAVDDVIEVYDLSNPEAPAWISTIKLTDPSKPLIFSLQRTGPDEYAVGASDGIYFLRRSLMAMTNSGVHPAVFEKHALPLSARTFGVTAAQLVVPNGGTATFEFRPPIFTVVKWLSRPVKSVDDILTISDPPINERIKELVRPRFVEHVIIDQMGPCPPSLDPPQPDRHHYVLVDAWGGTGAELKIAVESLDESGRLINPRSKYFPPTILTEQAGSLQFGSAQPTVKALTAKRLSSNPASPLYHQFLAGPFVVARQPLSQAQTTALANITGRQALWSGDFLRLSLDANSTGIGPNYSDWISQIVNNEYRPGVNATFLSLRTEYINTPNPSLREAHPKVAGVDLQGGEFRLSGTDVVVTGKHQPLVFSRVYESRSRYYGPMGLGWDFNYNARLFELKTAFLPFGFTDCPPHEYGDPLLDVPRTPGDVLFIDGMGGVHHFHQLNAINGNTNRESLYSSDPALAEFQWQNMVSRYYESPPGEFFVLYKFKDGAFVLLYPNGARTYFRADGRLARLVGTYPDSELKCVYRADGKLDRVSGDRGINMEFGYYGRTTSTDFGALDKPYSKVLHIGLLARVKTGSAEVKYEYDDDGALEKITDAGGKLTKLGYDSQEKHRLASSGRTDGSQMPAQQITYTSGLVDKVKQDGQDITFTGAKDQAKDRYQTPSGTLTVKLGGDPAADYKVDKRGRPTEFGNRTQEADDSGQLTRVANAHTDAIFTYDFTNAVFRFRGNLLRAEESGRPSFVTSYKYDGSAYNRLSARTNAELVATTYSYTAGTYVSQIDEVTGPVTRRTFFNNFGQLTEEKMIEGTHTLRRATFYDLASGLPNGQLVGNSGENLPEEKINVDGGGTANDRLKINSNSDGQLASVGGTNLPTATFGYDTFRVSSETISAGSLSVVNTVTFDSTDKGLVKSVTSRETGLPDSTTDYTYDQGRLKTMTTDGEATTFTYDGPLMTGVSGPGRSRTVTFTGGQVTAVTENGITTTMQYDSDGRVKSIGQQGATNTFTYNQGEQVKKRTVMDGTTLLDEDYAYDNAGRIQTVTSGGMTRSFDYFADGAQRKVLIDNVSVKEIERDSAGRVTSLTIPSLIKYTYSSADASCGQFQNEQLDLLPSGASVTVTKVFDTHGRATTQRWPAGDWKYVYDGFGNCTTKRDPDGVELSHTFSPSGFILTTKFADGQTINHTYATGRHQERVGVMDFVLDGEKLIQRINFPDGTYIEYNSRNQFMEPGQVNIGGQPQIHTWTEGRLTQIDGGADRLQYEFDGLGRKKSSTLNGVKVEFGYTNGQFNAETTTAPGWPTRTWQAGFNNRSHLLGEQYPSGLNINWASVSGLPSAASAVGVSSIGWQGPSLVKSVIFSSGVRITHTYDSSFRKTGIKYELASGGSTSTLAGFEYSLTPGGRVNWEKRLHGGEYDVYQRNAATEGMRIVNFHFSATGTNGQNAVATLQGITFDANGELKPPASVAVDARAFMPAMTFDTYSRVQTADGVAVQYNNQGSVTQTPVWVRLPGLNTPAREVATLTYDGLGNVQSLERGSGADKVIATYRRDGLGRVVERTVTGPAIRCIAETNQYVWKGRQLIEEYGGTNLLRRYVYVGENLLLVQLAPTPGAPLVNFIPLVNLNGSIGGYLNEAGFMREVILYGAYGTPVFFGYTAGMPTGEQDRSAIGSTILFQGAFFEPEFGLYLLGERVLSPQLGRFLQRDNELYVESKAMFTAFNGDPAGRQDPTGALSDVLQSINGLAENLAQAKSALDGVSGKWDTFNKALTDARSGQSKNETSLGSAGLELLSASLKQAGSRGGEDFKQFTKETIDGIGQIKSGLGLLQMGFDMRRDRLLQTAIKAHTFFPGNMSTRMRWLAAGGAGADFDSLDGNFWNDKAIKETKKFQPNTMKSLYNFQKQRGAILEKMRGNWFNFALKGSTFASDLIGKAAKSPDSMWAPPDQNLMDASKAILSFKDAYQKALKDKDLSKMEFLLKKGAWVANIENLYNAKDSLEAAFAAGNKLGQAGILYLSDPIVAEAYKQALKEYSDNGGATTVALGVLSELGFYNFANSTRRLLEASQQDIISPTLKSLRGEDPYTQYLLHGNDPP